MRTPVTLSVLVILTLPGFGWGADKKTSAKPSERIVGEWQGVKGPDARPNMSLHFEKDGTFKVKERRGPGLTRTNKKIEP